MINEEEKFDDLLRTKMSEREFFFDEENWQKLNEKIEEQGKRKKQRRTAFIFFAGLILGIGLTIPVMNMFKPNAIYSNTSNTQGSTTINPVTNLPPVATTNNATHSETEMGNATVPATTKENAANAGNVNNHAISENNAAPAPVEKTAPPSNSAKHNRASSDIAFVNTNTPVASVKKHRNNTLNNSLAVNNNSPALRGKSHRKNVASASNAMAVNNLKGDKQDRSSSADNNGATNRNEKLANNNTTGNSQSTSQGNGSANSNATAQANITSASETEQNNTLQNNTGNQQTVQKTADSGAQNKTAAVATTADKVPDVKTPARLKASNTLSIDAGGGYSFGWKNYGTEEANGITPVIGVSVTHLFSNKFGISAGIQYNSLSGLKTGYSNSVTSYDFGSRDSSTTVTPKTLQYITVPLMARYLIDDNNAICFGGSFGYLLNVSSTVTTMTQTALTNPTTKTVTANGYTGGFNSLDIQLRLAYRRRIYKAFSAGIEGYYGLTDGENTTYFDNTFKRNSGVRLIFSYDLIK